MGRQRALNPVSQSSRNPDSDIRIPPSVASEEFLPEKQPENPPVFIARMPNLEEPHSLRAALSSRAPLWNRFLEIKHGITDRQKICVLWCIIALLVCMLCLNMVNKPSSNSSDLVQTTTFVETAEEPSAPNSSVRSAREWEDEKPLPALSTTSIDLSQTAELPDETPSAFDSDQRYAALPTPSAWDRSPHSLPVTSVPSGEVSTPDFSVFAAPNPGAPQPSVNRYNEPQVQQVQYHQNPTTVPNYTGVYPSSQTPQSSVNYGQQAPSTNFNAAAQYQSPANYRQPEQSSGYNMAGAREEIPATFTNNTYRNPGTPQTMPQSGYGQYNPQPYAGGAPTLQPSNVPQYNQPNYGTAVLPVNTLNR